MLNISRNVCVVRNHTTALPFFFSVFFFKPFVDLFYVNVSCMKAYLV